MKWLQEHGVRFVLSFGRQAFRDGDKFRFWGGLVVEAVGAGKGLSDQQFDVCQRLGVEVRYATEGVSLIQDQKGNVAGLRVKGPDGFEDIAGRAVVLAAGGFEANAEMRCRYLGPRLGDREGSRHSLTTPATASRWRWTLERSPTGIGHRATRWRGT